MSKVLVVDDDPAVRDVLEHALGCEGIKGIRTESAADGKEALERLKRATEPFDLVILDVMLPGMDGFSVCREIRYDGAHRDVPVLMLTVRDDETSVVVGLEVGADDYISKPFSPRELVSRVRAHLRRRRWNTRGNGESTLSFPGLSIDLVKREVVSQGEKVSLTACQYKILTFLASSPGQVFSREQIMEHLHDRNFYGDSRAPDVHVQNIRKKIEPDPHSPHYLISVRGVGYKFSADITADGRR